MQKGLELVEPPHSRRAGKAGEPEYRAVTQGADREEWAVVDGQGCVVFRGDARVAAMIASRLTRPGR